MKEESENMRKLIKLFKWMAVIVVVFPQSFVHARLSFANRESSFVLKERTSEKAPEARVRFNPTTVYGWRDGSVTKSMTSEGEGDYNLLNYATGNVIAYSAAPGELVHSNSIALQFGIKNNSNTLLYYHRTDSNAYAYGIKNNSNALKYGITGNSQALLYLIRTHSNAYAYGIKNNSNAIATQVPSTFVDLLRYTSNAVLYLHRTDSGAFVYGIKNNSNTMLRYQRTDSAALMYLVRTHSAGYAFGIKNNSNALKYGITGNSQALLYLIRTHSNAYKFGIKNNSNTMLRYQRTDSAALMYLVRTHSAGYAFGIKNNSNTMLRYQRTDSAALMYLIRTHSNAYKFGIKNNSNTLLYVSRTHSNAIKWLDTQMQEIDNGPLNIEITTATYNMDFDFNLSGDHYATVSVDCTIEGDGHSINFARDAEDLIRISAGKTLTLNNVVLRGYSDGAVQLGAGASIVFGDGTYIELADKQTLSRDWTFDGAVQVNGFGYQLDLSDYNITVNEGASATFKNVSVDGLLGTNLNCADNTAEVKFNNTNLHMAGNYTFDHGAFSVEQNVVLSGTEESEFKYQSDQTSTIGADSTLVVDTGVKFSYEPVDSDDRDLIAMSDDTSRLYLNGCTLNTTTTGMRLTKGTLIVDGHNYLYDDDATSVSEGFSLGNGEATDDITIYLTPGAVLDLKSGYLDYNNDAVG